MSEERTTRTQVEANVDDLDPRVWPRVIEQLLAAGADDAWITPIVMKKGRPAFTLGVLCADEVIDAVRRIVFTETSSIGLRETTVTKHALPRSFASVDVDGHPVAIKRAELDGVEVNRSVEWDDVARVADALGLSATDVLAAALQASREQTQ
ncbi:MAG: nickel insertion protein [Actinomycetota bacterium]